MIPELGTFSIILALCFALLQALSPIYGRYKNNSSFNELGQVSVFVQFVFLVFAMLCLIFSFLSNDMTVIFVRDHSHTSLPILYRIGAAWGGHEGSLLLWCLILAGWSAVFTAATIYLPKNKFYQRFAGVNHTTHLREKLNVIMILGFLNAGFLLFLFTTSNPFLRFFPNSFINGADLTPVLQDPGLIFHPPMLYIGYVGFAIGFAFAISALIEGRFDRSWANQCRPWIIIPWSFLSCGIVLGSWWAYRELGWGGWWFWDPVENASLLPWLSATALIHSLIVTEKRNVFKGWTILLAIVTFTLSLLGTFLVRSGVLVSVHAFASDPTRGVFLLCYLSIIIGSSFLLYSLRIKRFYKSPNFNLLSRETFLLINSVILLSAVATIVIGTLYPIVLDALNCGKISVGEPYFNIVFLPIMIPALLLMGAAPHINWKQHSLNLILKKLSKIIIVSMLIGCFAPLLLGYKFYLMTACGISISMWIILGTLQYAYKLWNTNHKITLKFMSMVISHIGIAIITLGITVNKSYSEEQQVKISLGETTNIAGYDLTFDRLDKTKGSNFESITASFQVKQNHQYINTLLAEQRTYTSHQEGFSKPGVLFNSWRDLYLALGNTLPDNSWSIRIYYKPFVRWIWFGGFMLLIGGLFSLLSHLLSLHKANHEAR